MKHSGVANRILMSCGNLKPETPNPAVSFIISTFNRRKVLLDTLRRLRNCEIKHEIFVIDNASIDGTAQAVQSEFPDIRLIASNINRGPCSKNLALPLCRGEYITFLDDDSFPIASSVPNMIAHFDQNARLGAAGFTVTLPDGSRECSAYPNVFIGCGVGFRRAAIREVGGLPEDFFMQAEEYDLSLRLLDAGWHVETFNDLHVDHLKTPTARFSRRVTRLDVRNNLVLIARYFPSQWVGLFIREWLRRYWAIASSKGHRIAFLEGAAEGFVRIIRGANRRPISKIAFEQFAKIDQTRLRMSEAMAKYKLGRVLFAGYGKNMVAYRLAAQACGLEIVAIADDQLSENRGKYRGIPIVSDAEAETIEFDAVIVSNLSPEHARKIGDYWCNRVKCPVIDLFLNKTMSAPTNNGPWTLIN